MVGCILSITFKTGPDDNELIILFLSQFSTLHKNNIKIE